MLNRMFAAARSWSPPYSLPTAGNAVLIGTNTQDDIKPGAWNSTNLVNSCWGYGAGCLVPDYGDAGAYVIAGTGGHNTPPCVGAFIFDFGTATWSRLDNGNDLSWQTADYIAAALTDAEVTSATGNMPAPNHTYTHCLPLSAAQCGNSNGGVLMSNVYAADVDAGTASTRAYKLDLDTGAWSRYTTNKASDVVTAGTGWANQKPVVHDPIGDYVYMAPSDLAYATSIARFPAAGGAWSAVGGYDWPANHEGGPLLHAGLFVVVGTTAMKALDLSSPASGWQSLTVSGSLPTADGGWPRWHQYSDGNFYARKRADGATIYRIVPPATSPLSNAWSVSTQSIGGATFPADAGTVSQYDRMPYVPAIDCLAYFPGPATAVVLFRPSA